MLVVVDFFSVSTVPLPGNRLSYQNTTKLINPIICNFVSNCITLGNGKYFMSDCNAYIEKIYVHPDINALISKIKPESIRDDLRQEVAISLLEMPCDKVASLFSGDNLVRYAIKVCWLMATSKNSPFYYKYKKNDYVKAVEYLRTLQPMPTIPETFAVKASQYLSRNNQDVYSDHETRVFNKYIELGSCRKVALFYGIPINHTCNIVAKMKRELKSILIN